MEFTQDQTPERCGFTRWGPKPHLRSAHTMELVPVTSPCNKSQGLVASSELAIFAAKSSQFGPCD